MLFQLFIYTNHGLFFNGKVRSLTIKAIDGLVTILANHSPLTSVARISPFHFIDEHDKRQECFIGRGIFYVSQSECYIVADEVFYLKNLSKLILEKIQKKIEIEIEQFNDKHYSAMLRTSLKDTQNIIKKSYN